MLGLNAHKGTVVRSIIELSSPHVLGTNSRKRFLATELDMVISSYCGYLCIGPHREIPARRNPPSAGRGPAVAG